MDKQEVKGERRKKQSQVVVEKAQRGIQDASLELSKQHGGIVVSIISERFRPIRRAPYVLVLYYSFLQFALQRPASRIIVTAVT